MEYRTSMKNDPVDFMFDASDHRQNYQRQNDMQSIIEIDVLDTNEQGPSLGLNNDGFCVKNSISKKVVKRETDNHNIYPKVNLGLKRQIKEISQDLINVDDNCRKKIKIMHPLATTVSKSTTSDRAIASLGSKDHDLSVKTCFAGNCAAVNHPSYAALNSQAKVQQNHMSHMRNNANNYNGCATRFTLTESASDSREQISTAVLRKNSPELFSTNSVRSLKLRLSLDFDLSDVVGALKYVASRCGDTRRDKILCSPKANFNQNSSSPVNFPNTQVLYVKEEKQSDKHFESPRQISLETKPIICSLHQNAYDNDRAKFTIRSHASPMDCITSEILENTNTSKISSLADNIPEISHDNAADNSKLSSTENIYPDSNSNILSIPSVLSTETLQNILKNISRSDTEPKADATFPIGRSCEIRQKIKSEDAYDKGEEGHEALKKKAKVSQFQHENESVLNYPIFIKTEKQDNV